MEIPLIFAVVLVGISSAQFLQFEKDKPFILDTQTFNHYNGTIYSNTFSQLNTIKKLVIQSSRIERIEDGALCSSPFEQIEMISNDLLHLTAAMFGTCPSLKKLNFDNCINTSSLFSDDVFNGLRNLEEFNVFFTNRIIRLPNMKNLTQLKKLKISFSSLETIEEDAFEGTTNLEELDISGNKFRALDGKFFKNLNKLKKLNFGSAHIRNIGEDTFEGAENLEELDMSSNDFVEFDGKFLKHLNKLKELNLSGCKNMTSFPWDDLVSVPNLEKLEIGFGKVKRIEAAKLLEFCPKLKQFGFQGHDISCEVVREVIAVVKEKNGTDLVLDEEISNYKCAPVSS